MTRLTFALKTQRRNHVLARPRATCALCVVFPRLANWISAAMLSGTASQLTHSDFRYMNSLLYSVASSSSGVKVSTPFLLAVLFVYMTPVLSDTDCEFTFSLLCSQLLNQSLMGGRMGQWAIPDNKRIPSGHTTF